MIVYRIWEDRTGKWQVSELAQAGTGSDVQLGSFDTESDAFAHVRTRVGGNETRAAQSTVAQPWRGECPNCRAQTLRIRRYGGHAFHHCWAIHCGHEQKAS